MVTRSNKECISDNKLNKSYKPLLSARDISRYSLKFNDRFIFFDRSSIGGGCWKEEIYLSKEKLLVQLIRNLKLKRRLVVSYDNQQYYVLQNMNNIIMDNSKGYSVKYLLGILNSKLINYWFRKLFLDINIKRFYLKEIPIKKANKSEQEELVKEVDKILLLNKKLSELEGKSTSETKDLKEDIENIDKKIDSIVYKLYEITDKERGIIEES